VRVLILLGLMHMALSAERNGELLGLLAPLFLAAPMARQYAALRANSNEGGRRASPAAAAAALVLLFVPATVAVGAMGTIAPGARITPAGAVDILRADGATRILDDYDFGGYLVFAGMPTFIDGRTELYGGEFVLRHHRAVNLVDLADLERLLDEYRIDATLLSPSTPAVAWLDRQPGWQRVYADGVAVAHRRLSPTP
jgi:hypothetical protein